MKKHRKKTAPKVVFHMCTLVPITDPAEQAEIDRRFRAAKRDPSLGSRRKPKGMVGK
jgi:hypothetical protein